MFWKCSNCRVENESFEIFCKRCHTVAPSKQALSKLFAPPPKKLVMRQGTLDDYLESLRVHPSPKLRSGLGWRQPDEAMVLPNDVTALQAWYANDKDPYTF